MKIPKLRIIATGNNAVGDTLTRLSADLFQTLGYDDCRINVHKTGRELDVKGRHAFEDRLLIAECKAQKNPIGGSDINKFVGVVDAERRRAGKDQVYGYYVSVSGYTESAREQEEELGNSRIIMLDARDIVTRIGASNIVISAEDAALSVGKFIATAAPNLEFKEFELVAHAHIGWLWAAYFSDEFARTFACFVHADGQVVGMSYLSQLAIEGVELLGKTDEPSPERDAMVSQVYRDYLVKEYGGITLEGMPVDQEVGSRAFRLEDLYVPLSLEAITAQEIKGVEASLERSQSPNPGDPEELAEHRLSIGQLLHTVNRLSVLGPPGSGKSTLIKRLAVAYCDPTRLEALHDDLPVANWLPVAVRCRHLGASVDRPISEMLRESFLRSEHEDLADEFVRILGERLREGSVLLLVDGLDEIPTSRARSTLVSQLRTFLARYPQIKLVLTSREVGFRHVAGAVYSICSPYKVAELTDDDIFKLVHTWHREVVGAGKAAQTAAEDLAFAIVDNDRVRRLAVNPLLLTTLLLVQRWVGQLPRKRTVLYQKAIEVLLMTWNVEGHEPVDLEEALPQLGYAAYQMMVSNRSSVSSAELSKLFQEARNEMPELLAYSPISVQTFLSRVEERSSLLILSGYQLADGNLVPIYEFKHLTFQEYLAAKALVNRWLPASFEQLDLYALLEGEFEEPRWSEVVRMAAVLAGRIDGTKIVRRLIELTALHEPDDKMPVTGVACSNLIGCLGDDVALAPDVAREAIETALFYELSDDDSGDLCEALHGGRYYPLLTQMVIQGLSSPRSVSVFARAMMRVVQLDVESVPNIATLIDVIRSDIRSENFERQVSGVARLMLASYYSNQLKDRSQVWSNGYPVPKLTRLRNSLDYVAKELATQKGDVPPGLVSLQTWALAWGGPAVTKRPDQITAVRVRLFDNWIGSGDSDLQYKSCWAFGTLPLVGGCHSVRGRQEIKRFLLNFRRLHEKRSGLYVTRGLLVAGLYFDFVWPREKLAEMAGDFYARTSRRSYDKGHSQFAETFLNALGGTGREELQRRKNTISAKQS